MDKPSEKNINKMSNYAEKFAEKSGTYLHPDRSVTDTVVEGLARHIECGSAELSSERMEVGPRRCLDLVSIAPHELDVQKHVEVHGLCRLVVDHVDQHLRLIALDVDAVADPAWF